MNYFDIPITEHEYERFIGKPRILTCNPPLPQVLFDLGLFYEDSVREHFSVIVARVDYEPIHLSDGSIVLRIPIE